MNRLCCLFILVMVGASGLNAQAIKLRHKFLGDTLMVRWHPNNADQWLQGLQTGYQLEISENGNIIFKTDAPIFPAPFADWQAQLDSLAMEWYEPALYLIYYDQADPDLQEETFPSDEYNSKEILNARFSLLEYFCHQDFHLTLMAGLGWSIIAENDRSIYTIKVRLDGHPETANTVVISKNDSKPAAVPLLKAEWLDRQVALEWNVRGFEEDYFGYRLEHSEDGKEFIWLDSIPIICQNKEFDNTLFGTIKENRTLLVNLRAQWFRLKGLDYFGGVSGTFSEVSGSGHPGLIPAPILEPVQQQDGEHFLLQWSIPQKFEGVVSSFSIFKAETPEGPYVLDTAGLNPGLRQIIRTSGQDVQYFRIEVLDTFGRSSSSFPQMAMPQDEQPPAVPSGLSGRVDSTGIVSITWSRNTEKDFWGYKVFTAPDTTGEFSLAHTGIVQEPIFVDTLALNVLNEGAYYKITALDYRNNRSGFSKVLEIKRPDKIPPVEPQIFKVNAVPNGVSLSWYPSPSKDANLEWLMRKEWGSSGDWTTVGLFESGSADTQKYLDSTVLPDRTYWYTLIAVDMDGNRSVPADTAVVQTFSLPVPAPLLGKARIEEGGRNCSVSWQPTSGVEMEIWIYRASHTGRPELIGKSSEKNGSYLDKEVPDNIPLFYWLRKVDNNGRFSAFSEIIYPDQ